MAFIFDFKIMLKLKKVSITEFPGVLLNRPVLRARASPGPFMTASEPGDDGSVPSHRDVGSGLWVTGLPAEELGRRERSVQQGAVTPHFRVVSRARILVP